MGDLSQRIDAIWRIESARLIAALARLVRDVGLAEELAQDAFVLALQQWPEHGIPENPGAAGPRRRGGGGAGACGGVGTDAA